MQKLIVFTVMLAYAAAAPAYLFTDNVYHSVPYSKSTLTKSSQVVDHGSTYIHTPVVPVLHAHLPSKTTVTKSNQVVNHGGLAVVHPILHYEDVYHTPVKTITSNQHGSTALLHTSVPVVHSSPILYHSSPYYAVKSGDSAISHHSSTVHETVPVVNHYPLVSLHH